MKRTLPARGPVPMAQARAAMRALGRRVKACRVTPAALREGMAVEREHRDVTRGDVVKTARVALAHLCERPDYYKRLKRYVEGGSMRRKRKLGDPPEKHVATAERSLDVVKQAIEEIDFAMRRQDCMEAVAWSLRANAASARAIAESDYGRSVPNNTTRERARAAASRVNEETFGRVLQACVVKKR